MSPPEMPGRIRDTPLHADPEEQATPVREPCALRSGRMNTAFDSSGEESKPVCRREPADWGVDAATPEKLRPSARACVHSCPLYALSKDVVSSGAVKPRSMVWAGRAYGAAWGLLHGAEIFAPSADNRSTT